ncbi:hypothetical protein PI124_g22528 [Phytophthora idaei]|nr:hypothetical protein PI124_g22528 [Phytophthora idaei]
MCPLLVPRPEVKARREDAGKVEDVAEEVLVETNAASVLTLDMAEVTSGVGKLMTSLIMLLREGTEHTTTDTPW